MEEGIFWGSMTGIQQKGRRKMELTNIKELFREKEKSRATKGMGLVKKLLKCTFHFFVSVPV